MSEPTRFLREELPLLVAAGLDALRADPAAPAARALTRLDAIRMAIRVTLRGEADEDVLLVLDAGALRSDLDLPPGELQGHALALPAQALGLWLEQYRARIEPGPLAGRLAQFSDPRALTMFGDNPVSFDLHVSGVPALGDLELRVSLGRVSLPGAGDFRVRVSYDDLRLAREQGLGPQQLLAGGKLRLEGDAARAMGLGMMLMQLRRMANS